MRSSGCHIRKGRLDANGGADFGVLRSHFSSTHRVPSGTSRAKSEVVFSDLFRRKLRDGRSRKDRSERGAHDAKGTLYVGELFGRPVAPH